MKLGSVQFLRAIAAILVAYAHSIDLQMKFATSFQQNFFYLQNFGAFGVDIFFVISGFVISLSAGRYQGWQDGLHFLVRRFLRVNPIYYIASLIFLGLTMLAYGKTNVFLVTGFHQLLKTGVLLPILDKTQWMPPLLPVAWTLSFEWFFYSLFFIAIVFRIRHKTFFLLLLVSALPILGYLLHSSDYRMLFITNPIFLEFGLGVFLYWCYTRWTLSGRRAASLLGIGIVICLYEIIKGFGNLSELQNIIDGSLSLTRFFYWGLPAGLLVAGCLFLEKKGRLRSVWNNPVVALIGNASYSIYLVSDIVYESCALIYARTGFFLPPDLAILVQLLLVIACGIIFYKKVENPLLHRLRRPHYSTADSVCK